MDSIITETSGGGADSRSIGRHPPVGGSTSWDHTEYIGGPAFPSTTVECQLGTRAQVPNTKGQTLQLTDRPETMTPKHLVQQNVLLAVIVAPEPVRIAGLLRKVWEVCHGLCQQVLGVFLTWMKIAPVL